MSFQLTDLILEIFPGIGLLGRGFELAGFCVVRGPDLLWGQDIRGFHVPTGRFDGIIGGPPCQDFSRARRAPPTGYGLAMLEEFKRIVIEARPAWWLCENVDRVPDIKIDGYTVQRLDLNAKNCGLTQSRLRHFQFGSLAGLQLAPQRQPAPAGAALAPACLATEGRRVDRRNWGDFCALQGLDPGFRLPGMRTAARYAAVGNGVPIPMGEMMARAIRAALAGETGGRLCACGCGRQLAGRGDQKAATAACRTRLQKKRETARRDQSG
jgi:DNA (cytosine-5)-methyltransferase 1